MPFVELSAVTKAFDGVTVINQVDCGVEKGEFFCILGPSGCGKSTLLRLIAGLEKLDGGLIAVGGKPVSDSSVHVAPESRNVGIVFQSYALWPHMTVAGNVEYPLRTAKADPARRRDETAQALRSVHMTEFADRRPHTLSGGQQQRVALARCLTQKPAVVLMDEPLANLDMHLRGEMLREFREFRDSSDSTIIYITHDQSEAMSVADRIAVMFEGRLVQVASPESLYDAPADADIARFIGVSSVVRGTLKDKGTAVWDSHHLPVRSNGSTEPGQTVDVCIRPEAIHVGEGPINARVSAATYLGGRYLAELSIGEATLRAYVNGGYRPAVGDTVNCTVRDGWTMPTPKPSAVGAE